MFLDEPVGHELPQNGFDVEDSGYQAPDVIEILKLDTEDFQIDKNYFRPNEVHNLVGDFRKARKILKWKPLTNFDKLISEMIDADLKEIF